MFTFKPFYGCKSGKDLEQKGNLIKVVVLLLFFFFFTSVNVLGQNQTGNHPRICSPLGHQTVIKFYNNLGDKTT